jgi:hypothetical protein
MNGSTVTNWSKEDVFGLLGVLAVVLVPCTGFLLRWRWESTIDMGLSGREARVGGLRSKVCWKLTGQG